MQNSFRNLKLLELALKKEEKKNIHNDTESEMKQKCSASANTELSKT